MKKNFIYNLIIVNNSEDKIDQRMFSQFEDFDPEQSKGLFTFYREQAEKEEEIKKIKKERKLAKMKETEKRRLIQQQAIKQVRQPGQLKDNEVKAKQQKNQQKQDRERRNLYQPKNKREKYERAQLGSSVVIINSKEIEFGNNTERVQKPSQVKNNLKKIQELINPFNNNRYFLQNRELPISFGKVSIQKEIIKNENEENQKQEKKRKALRPSYFNSCSQDQVQKKYIPTFSYQKLPQLTKNTPGHSEMIIPPKKYKSKKVQTALKSNNSELIRQIRQSLRQQSILQRISFIDANNRIATNQMLSLDKEYENRLNSHLDPKQKRLIDILRNSSNARKKKFV